MVAQLGAREAELSKALASVKELEERSVRAERSAAQSDLASVASSDSDEAIRKRLGQLQTQVYTDPCFYLIERLFILNPTTYLLSYSKIVVHYPQVDLLRGEKETHESKLKSTEKELRELRASASVRIRYDCLFDFLHTFWG